MRLALLLTLAAAMSVVVCRRLHRQPSTEELCVPKTTEICGAPATIALIHVGKTGGMTVSGTLKAAGVQFTEVHDEVHNDRGAHESILGNSPSWGTPGCAAAASFTHFVVMLRDPVARTVSAFNFVSRPDFLADARLMMQFAGGEAMYAKLYDACFPHPGGPNAFAEALDEQGACGDVARRCACTSRHARISARARRST